METLVEAAVALLREARIPLGPGLTHSDLTQIERKYRITFCSDHAGLLSAVTPMGPGWVDWLGDPATIVEWLDWPLSGVLFDVEHGEFWFEEWGKRPYRTVAAVRTARQRMKSVPKLVPLCGHRYLPAGPSPEGSPVLSVHQTDVIYYGSNLAHYIALEFLGRRELDPPITVRVDFWSDLAEN